MDKVVQSKLTARQPWMFGSRLRLFGTMFLVVAIPTLIIVTATILFVSKREKEQAVIENTVMTRLVAKHLDEEFFGLRRYVESFATRRRIIDALKRNDTEAIQEQVTDLVEQNKKISRAVLTDQNGVLRFDYPPDPQAVGKDFSYRDWFIGASTRDRPYVSEAYHRAALDKAVVVMVATKVHDEGGRVMGYLGAQYLVKDMLDWLASVQTSPSKRIALFDQKGSQVLRVNAANHLDISQHRGIQGILNRPEGTGWVEGLDGFGKCVVTHVPIPDLAWTVICYEDADIIFAPVKQLVWTILLFSLVALAAMTGLGWMSYRIMFAYAEDLRRSNKELENVCYSIAHDLRAPLRSMQGFTSMLQESGTKLDTEGQECARKVRTSAERMDKLLTDLLEYGSVAHRNLELQTVELDEVIEKAIRSVSIPAEEKMPEFSMQAPLGKIVGDKYLLGQAVNHLLLNAIKFCTGDKPPKVEVWSDKQPEHIRLWIRDNGIGIASEYQQKIFGIFQRLHRSDLYPGTGIGLAIVKKAVERMGGGVGVLSEPGKGSSFWIELPTR